MSFDAAVSSLSEASSDLRIWWTVSAMLVLLMQLGFISLEMGCVRIQTRPGIALKNFSMLLVSSLTFTMLGVHLMYGGGHWNHLIGTSNAILLGNSYEWFFLQVGFATVAATILSGALAGRTTLFSNMVLAFVMALVIYPVYGHWMWNDQGWLKIMGAHDFAGSGVVHFIGGFTALIAAKFAGPRAGFIEDGKVQDIGAPNYPFVTVAVIFLWVGWIGFNGGSVTLEDVKHDFSLVGGAVMATCVAASAGGLFALLISAAYRFFTGRAKDLNFSAAFRQRLLFDPWSTLGGTMGGMVAITANCDWIQVYDNFLWLALAIGVVGGGVSFGCAYLVKYVLKVDDPVDAIAVHAGAGAAGILIAAGATETDFLTQVIVLTAAVSWVTVIAVPVLKILKKFDLLRASIAEEEMGLTFDSYESAIYSPELMKRRRSRVMQEASAAKGESK